eukprot:CAMPEP_0171315972 /NCGR_PEP_ID=MMETSP0816-20121228/68639_1 /TAXON_ID=420281 /ORGANISM="Proboscia inermis, Strain CCAP1064/1" /LENGTH=32 /DNA_ID= /DNA_START= /DNA_END= /DNA_ORIENTATION=
MKAKPTAKLTGLKLNWWEEWLGKMSEEMKPSV